MDVYRNLQKHMDKMPVGYPATKTGVEISLLKYIFTPEAARIVIYLDYKYKTVDQIYETVGMENVSKEDVKCVLDEIVSKGGIFRRERDGQDQYISCLLFSGECMNINSKK